MGISTRKLGEIGPWILVLCALLTTGLVVRREFAGGTTDTRPSREAIYLEGWQDALAVGTRSGSAGAPVQVVEFADFQCPACARFEATVQTVRAKYPNDVAFTFVHFPLPQHTSAEAAARVAECAEDQGRFEAMRALLFEKQNVLGSIPWTDFGKQAGVPELAQFDACVDDTQPMEKVEKGKKLVEVMNVRGTPTIFVNGWKLPFTPSAEDFGNIVTSVADGKSPNEAIDSLVASVRD